MLNLYSFTKPSSSSNMGLIIFSFAIYFVKKYVLANLNDEYKSLLSIVK